MKWVRRLALVLGILLAGALLLEAAFRIRLYRRAGTFSSETEYVIDPATGLGVPDSSYETPSMRINARNFRGPDVLVPKPPGRIRLAFLGGSTTFCAQSSREETTWPCLVRSALAEHHPEASFDYVNASFIGYRLEHLSKTLEHRVKPLAPDVVVVYEATNDLTNDTRELAIEAGIYDGHGDRDSWLARHSLAWYLIEKNLLYKLRKDEALGSGKHLALDTARIAPGFQRRLVALIREAQAVAPVVAVATFSQRLRRGQTPAEQQAACVTHVYYMPYLDVEGLLAGFDAYNAAIRAAAAETGAILVEGEDEIPGDEVHFRDSVHFYDPGCERMAARVVRGLEASGAFRELVERAR